MNKLISTLLSPFQNNSTKIITEKNILRQKVRELKSQITEVQKQKDADSVFNKIESLLEFKKAKTILIYWSSSDELPTHAIVEKWSCEKKILLPSVQGDDITIKRYDIKQKMTKGILGIWEPEISENYNGKIDLVIVPGVTFDLKKNRLGRGKGYYDRFLKHTKAPKWGIGFDCQLISSIPTNKQDVRMDKIITPTQIIE